MIDKRLTEEEAEDFIQLIQKLDKDMNDMWEDLPGASSMGQERFKEEYDASSSKVKMALLRKRYKEFCEMVYL